MLCHLQIQFTLPFGGVSSGVAGESPQAEKRVQMLEAGSCHHFGNHVSQFQVTSSELRELSHLQYLL